MVNTKSLNKGRVNQNKTVPHTKPHWILLTFSSSVRSEQISHLVIWVFCVFEWHVGSPWVGLCVEGY